MVKDNRGLSLVELVAVMAIMVIVSTALIGFMVAGLRQYQEANSEISRQSETQMVSNQLQDLLIDTSNGVKYDNTAKEIWAYNTETEAGSVVYTATKISWDATEQELLFSKYKYAPEVDGSYTMNVDSEDQLMGEHISDFSADLSQMESKNMITFSMEITVRNKSYITKCVVNLRNKIKEVSGEAEAFQETTIELSPVVKNVIISPSNAVVWQGGTYGGFSAVVNGINYPAQDVSWSFSENTLLSLTDANTTIDAGSGMVTLGENETCEVLTVTATSVESKKDGAPSSDWVSGTATLLNKYVDGIQIGALKNTADMSAEADVSVTGANFEGNEDLSNYITFEIKDEDGKVITDIKTSLRAVSGQTAGEKSEYVFKASAPADKYRDKMITVQPILKFNGQTWYGNKSSVTFREQKILGLTLQMQNENGEWVDCGNTSYTGNRGEKLSFRMKASYGSDADNVEYEGYWLPGDAEWSDITWKIKRGGKETTEYGDPSQLGGSGTFTLGDLTRFSPSNSYSFSLNAEYRNKDDSVVSQSVNITIPEVSMSILERHDNQTKEFMTVGESQTIHFVVAGIDSSLYSIGFESVENSVMQQGNVRNSGDMAILTPQIVGTGDMKFNLVDKEGNAIKKGTKAISVTLPLEIGNKNIYVRTGAFGSYGYMLTEGSMFVPSKNYSTKSTVMYSLNGVKIEYKTSSTLLGTVKTIRISDGDISYTGATYNGEDIWYR